MTVEELIEALRKMPSYRPVRLKIEDRYDPGRYWAEVETIRDVQGQAVELYGLADDVEKG